jgi:probable H4MPT-linked C1 transfer pathway protein
MRHDEALGKGGRMAEKILGWDIGGAHLKLAATDGDRLVAARQVACPLWRGLDELRHAAEAARVGLPEADRHAVTMTGELADIFPDRASGVVAILDALGEFVDTAQARVYGTAGEFLSVAEASTNPDRVASANWHATAQLIARRTPDGLLVDVGSTTTDIVPFRGGRIVARGAADAERLTSGELVYTGIARTPLAAIARDIPFGGRRIGVMAEYFATAADAHRLAGTLPDGADIHPAADNRGKTPAESRARLARMIGMDAAAVPEAAWRDLAEAFIRCQLRHIEEGAETVLSALELPRGAPVVGAGTGRFLAADIARRLDRPYRSFEEMVETADSALAGTAADIAPAVAVALLLAGQPD